MQNIVGKPVEKDNFFPRENIINKIYRRLETDNVFMSAPRRVGKTSLMYHLRDNPKDGFVFVFINTEAVKNSEEFFRKVLLQVLDSEAVKLYKQTYEKSKNVFEKILGNISKFKIYELEIELNSKETKGSFFEEFKTLIQELEDEGLKIVVMIDEFPTTIENIATNHGDAEAVNFLQLNRELRLLPSKAIRFIYTGSIGLPVLVRKLEEPEVINDLNVVEVPPLTKEEAESLINSILASYNIPISIDATDYLIERIEWLMPFFIQLSVQELIDAYEDNPAEITKETVDFAFKKIYNRRNNLYFESYSNRLKEAFPAEDEFNIAKTTLARLSATESLSYNDLFGEWAEDNIHRRNKIILDTLEYDGYIFNHNGVFRFNSPILKNWWKQNVL